MTEFKDLVDNTIYEIKTPICNHCKKGGVVEVPMKGFLIRQLGGLIQEAYPDLHFSLREQLISGTHPECWIEMFGKGGHE
jgi:hypothetical protein